MLAVVISRCRIKEKRRLRWRRATRLWFPGQRYDSASGLSQNYFRDYEAGTGRYVQSDPIGLDGGISTYGYVGGNSLIGIDPKGLVGIFARCPTGMVKDCPWPFTRCTCKNDGRTGACGNVDCLLLEGNHPNSPNNSMSLCEYDRLGNNICYTLCMSGVGEQWQPPETYFGHIGDAAELIGGELNNVPFLRRAGGYGQAADYLSYLIGKVNQDRRCKKKCGIK